MLKEQQTSSSSSSSSSSSFFLFPNPNPVMRSFNIPESMIHPQGIHICSFLNPKPNADDKLKPMSPLDVDPCAASRTDVITYTNTSDLTPSEHAGGSFTEPPMAPMASNSPANSETGPPQIVNDVVETKIESGNSQSIRCEICKVSCNSEEMLREHKEGKKHLKNIQKLSVSSPIIQETPPLVADATSDHETDKKKKKEDFLQNVPSVESLFTCTIPDLVCHDRNIDTEHLHGEKQETQVNNGTLVQSSNNGTEKVEEEVCKVTCNSEQKLQEHNPGKNHLKNLKDSEKIQTPPSTTPIASMAKTPVSKHVEKVEDSKEVKFRWCEVCKIDYSSDTFYRHLRGRNHKRNLQESKKMTGLPSTHTDSGKLTKGEVVNPNEGSSTRCELCKVCCTSYDELNRHLSGKKHKKAEYKTGKRMKGERMLQDMMNGEGKVVILEKGKRKANDSLASEEDGDVKRKKMMKEGGTASGASITCAVCNVGWTSVVDYMDHLKGQEHSAMVLKQV
ncbi:unnamed protein product [Lactuca virosa]|uniref:Matrin-type domain-containing protein n=1 Tax=Lactuca virosa TaxID=75947 RepID=A0AAU9M781_9ASTR|nr:unnamed protein product [Lactuca virosa]